MMGGAIAALKGRGPVALVSCSFFVFLCLPLPYNVAAGRSAGASVNTADHIPQNQGYAKQKATGYANPSSAETHVESIQMMRHSIEPPISQDNALVEWDLAGTTIPTGNHVVLSAAVANRTGQFWNKTPLRTDNFQVQFQFQVVGPEMTTSEGFALWYVREPYAFVAPKTAADLASWKLFGYKNNPSGLGVLFSNFDRHGRLNPSISVGLWDGTQVVTLEAHVPTTDGVYYGFRNSEEPLQFKLTVGPMGVLGQIKQSGGGSWLDCFRVGGMKLEPNGYLGFSSSNRVDHPQAQRGADRIIIQSIKTYNFDMTRPGEDAAVLQEALADVDVGDILKDHNQHKSEKEQTDALRQLTRMVYKHISEATPREQAMNKAISSLQSQVHKVAQELKELHRELRESLHLNHSEGLQSMQSELSGLRTLLTKHSQQQASSISSLSKSLTGSDGADTGAHVREVRKLAATIKSQTYLSSWMIIGLIILVVGFAFLIWKRVREMEKKHFL